MSGALKFRGVHLTLGGVVYVMPALSLGAFEEHGEAMERIDQLPRKEQLSLTLTLAHRALQRNYPEMTREQVGELVDVHNASEVYAACLGASIPAKEADDAGEGGVMVGGTGSPSTPTSPPVSDGPSSTAESASPSTS